MNNIKSLADQIREKIKSEEVQENTLQVEKSLSPVKSTKVKSNVNSKSSEEFFQSVDEYQLVGSEKMLIRLDSKTTNLLKHLKLTMGIDMNKFIAFGLHSFLEEHAWLPAYVKEKLKNAEL